MTISRVSALVTTNWLKQKIASGALDIAKATPSSSKLPGDSQPIRVLDTSWLPEPHVNGYKEFYRKGHIPGASHFDLKKLSTKRPDSPIDCPIPDSNLFQDYVESLGITNKTHVIAYDSLNTRPSVRAWYLFRLYGHDKVSILNGGMTQWQRDGFTITKEEPKNLERSSFKVKFRPELLLDYKSMLQTLIDGNATVVDSRPAVGGFYITDDDTSGGCMPGAKSIPFPTFFNEDGTFKSEGSLQSLMSSAGVDMSKPLVATCQRGMTACAVAVAAFILGKEDVPVYNGSWLEWSVLADPKYIVKNKKE